jgi:hypothetical protein
VLIHCCQFVILLIIINCYNNLPRRNSSIVRILYLHLRAWHHDPRFDDIDAVYNPYWRCWIHSTKYVAVWTTVALDSCWNSQSSIYWITNELDKRLFLRTSVLSENLPVIQLGKVCPRDRIQNPVAVLTKSHQCAAEFLESISHPQSLSLHLCLLSPELFLPFKFFERRVLCRIGKAAGVCECCSKLSDSIKFGEFLD